MKKHV
jgi:hypothetical protein